MACAALMDQQIQPLYFCHLDHPLAPGVRNLQQWIEDAWKQGLPVSILWLLYPLIWLVGYDAIGAKELDNKLVGTKKFIGTAGNTMD